MLDVPDEARRPRVAEDVRKASSAARSSGWAWAQCPCSNTITSGTATSKGCSRRGRSPWPRRRRRGRRPRTCRVPPRSAPIEASDLASCDGRIPADNPRVLGDEGLVRRGDERRMFKAFDAPVTGVRIRRVASARFVEDQRFPLAPGDGGVHVRNGSDRSGVVLYHGRSSPASARRGRRGPTARRGAAARRKAGRPGCLLRGRRPVGRPAARARVAAAAVAAPLREERVRAVRELAGGAKRVAGLATPTHQAAAGVAKLGDVPEGRAEHRGRVVERELH